MSHNQTNRNIALILLFLNHFFMFYQAFGVNLSFNRFGMFVTGGACMSIRYCASIRTYSVSESHTNDTISWYTSTKLHNCYTISWRDRQLSIQSHPRVSHHIIVSTITTLCQISHPCVNHHILVSVSSSCHVPHVNCHIPSHPRVQVATGAFCLGWHFTAAEKSRIFSR